MANAQIQAKVLEGCAEDELLSCFLDDDSDCVRRKLKNNNNPNK